MKMNKQTYESGKPVMDIMLRLREETNAEHIATEKAIDIEPKLNDLESYCHLLTAYHGFYQGMDKLVSESIIRQCNEINDIYQPKANWILKDLSHLKISNNLPYKFSICNLLPFNPTIEQSLGILYVGEGSMLGGQIIFRNLKQNLGLDENNGARFFYGYGNETGARWRKFGDIVRKTVAAERAHETIQAARETFQVFQKWVTEQNELLLRLLPQE